MTDKQNKLKKLRKLEKTCMVGAIAGAATSITGAFLGYDTVFLIGTGFMALPTIGGIYSANKQTCLEKQEYREDSKLNYNK
jgi:hypothetical protein